MRPYGSKPAIPSPVGVTDPVVLRVLLAVKEAIERLTDEVEVLKRQVNPSQVTPVRANALPGAEPRPARFSPPMAQDDCGND